MIIKKPYAFLIKNFKYIHAVLFIFLSYILIKFYNLLKFFSDYVKTGYYTYYENLSSHFINFYLFIVIIFTIVIGIAVYILMKSKDKKRTYYIFLCTFYFILFIFLMYLFSVLKTLETEVLDIRNIRIIRDILLILTLPQLYFVIFCFLRSIGFDIKSFDFKKDLEELNISAEDSEIIEVLVPNDSYKHMRKLRRFLRETKYFIVEYRFYFLVGISLLLLIVVLSLFLNISVYNKKYSKNEDFISSSFKYTVEDSFITTVDYKGDTIKKDKSYIIIKINVVNISNKKDKLESDNFRLIYEDVEFTNTLSKGNYFIDLGETYVNQSLVPNEEYNFLIVFEVDNKYKSDKYTFRIIDKVDNYSGEINTKNKDVVINPTLIDYLDGMEEYTIGSEILLGESNLNASKFQVNTFDINNTFEEKFNYCVEKYCFEGVKKFVPNIINSTKKTLIRLTTSYTSDENIYIKKEVKNSTDFISYFAKIHYELDNKAKTSNIKVLESENINKNKVFFEVPIEVLDAKKVKLFITIRNIRYIIILK